MKPFLSVTHQSLSTGAVEEVVVVDSVVEVEEGSGPEAWAHEEELEGDLIVTKTMAHQNPCKRWPLFFMLAKAKWCIG